MKRLVKYVSLILVLLCLGANNFLLAQENQKKEEKKFTSLWEGKLKIGAVTLRLVIKVFKNDDGSLGAYLDSPDQNVKDIPISSISFTEDSLKFESKTIQGKYAGVVIKNSATIKGQWKQVTLDVPLDLKKIDKLVEVKRPQNPQKPYPYNDEEVTFENKSANITLAGTFTYSKGDGKFPAVVLVTGSGPQDRDESLMNHKPFLIISDYLTRNGIAVLRYDDRGIGKSKGNFAAATSEDFATDALAAVEYLKTRKEVNPKKIGIAGHSEGGLIAPICAVNSKDVAFIVMLAGPGVSGKEILILQTELIMKAEGSKEEDIKKSVEENKSYYNIISEETDSTVMYKKFLAMYDKDVSKLTDEEKKKPEYSKESFDRAVKTLLSPWFRFFVKYDPWPTIEQIAVPVLALNGEKDLQVPPFQNLPKIEEALKVGGNKKFKTIELPGLNHLFQPAKTGGVSEYGNIETTFSEDALKIMKDWILEITK